MNIKQIVKEIFSNIKKDWYLPVTEHQVYSEQETVVGVWTDGKPLYRKAILSTTSKTGWVVAHTEPEAEMLRVVLCDVNVADGTNDWLPASYQTPTSRMCYSIKGNSIKYEMTAVSAGKHVRLVIEYTKTTDTPTTSKVPFEPLIEYSTDEKMIGYWVDGKPIYRKVIKNITINRGANRIDYGVNIGQLIERKLITNVSIYPSYISSQWGAWATNDNNTGFTINLGSSEGSYTASLIIEYTKATD